VRVKPKLELIISALLYFNKGNSRKLITVKLKLGAIILSLSWFTSACEPTQTCYLPAQILPPVNFVNGSDTLNLSLNDTLKLIVATPNYQYYSFRIVDSLFIIRQDGLCLQKPDSVYKGGINLFIPVDSIIIKPGKYGLEIYGEPFTNLKYLNKLQSFPFYVK